jgi:hypothetical protein
MLEDVARLSQAKDGAPFFDSPEDIIDARVRQVT